MKSGKGWARFFARGLLGLTFAMAGWFKCFEMTPWGHAERFFTGPYADTWIPWVLLWAAGVAIPVLELLAGACLIVGFRVRESLLVVGAILLLVTYGHLLKEPLYSLQAHVFPRAVLMMVVFVLEEDSLSLDKWLKARE